MTNTQASYQLPDLSITNMFVDLPSTQLDNLEIDNTDMLLAQELLSDLVPPKSSRFLRN